MVLRFPLPTSYEVSKYFFTDEWTAESEPTAHSSPSSSMFEPNVNDSPKISVSDVIIFDAYRPLFYLNVEAKKTTEKMSQAVQQCFIQMMTQMHFQDVHFGLVLFPTQWSLIVVSKPAARIYRIQMPMFGMSRDHKHQLLDVESFISMVKWVESILKWQALPAQ